MNSCELKDLFAKIVGLRLTVIGYACNMPMFNFENNDAQYAIYSQCLTRIIKNGDLLVTTLDYQSWDGEHDENNDFMYNLIKFKSEIEGGIVLSVEVNSLFDVVITLDNGAIIQILIENSYSHFGEEREQYRFFELGADDEPEEQEKQRKHCVVYSKHIDFY